MNTTTTNPAASAVLIADAELEAAVEKFAELVTLAETERTQAEAAAASVKAATADLSTLDGLDPLEIVRAQESARLAKMRADAATVQARRYGDALARFQQTARNEASAIIDRIRVEITNRLEQTLRRAGFGDNWQVAAGLHPLSAELHHAQAIANFPAVSVTREEGGKRYGIAPRESLPHVVRKLDAMRASISRLRALTLPS
jgi:hypothetical protein